MSVNVCIQLAKYVRGNDLDKNDIGIRPSYASVSI